ncbi:hypothetical protein CKM354_000529200 [Cercospora kikuchii]|uniref:DUF7888 domain-containing protein n=1 Tax=Cercospora kikuchii TaxID=84275 RepID=A0A9P3CFX3_9PEZI|nr:uncharacterized protein CKM354_000529200 [Cercospora kikuchii]GIZ42011.1 hypothetical protein CKM354_000529200 [Cercospora kikuchii]
MKFTTTAIFVASAAAVALPDQGTTAEQPRTNALGYTPRPFGGRGGFSLPYQPHIRSRDADAFSFDFGLGGNDPLDGIPDFIKPSKRDALADALISVIGAGNGRNINARDALISVIGAGNGRLATRDLEDVRRAIGAGAAAVLGGVVSGVVAPAVTVGVNAISKAFRGGNKRAVDEVSYEDASAEFIDAVVKSIAANGVDDGTAGVCTSVEYTISAPGSTRDANGVRFERDGKTTDYDCFLLAAGGKFSVSPADLATKGAVAVAGGSFDKDGVLTVA